MPDKIDRRIGDNNHLMVVVLIFLAIAGAVGTYLFGRMSALPSQPEAQPAFTSQLTPVEERLTITLSVPGSDGMLSAEMISLSRQIETQAQAREALIAALADQRLIQTPVLNRVKLRGFFLDDSGTGYVDLWPAANGSIQASAREELLAVYALVNILSQNFEEIRRVRFLIDGKEAPTLAGHIDLSRNFTKRMDLMRQ